MSQTYKIGIVGVGMVGGVMQRWFEKQGAGPLVYDKFKNLGSPEEVKRADILFIAVNTPYNSESGGFDLSQVERALDILKDESKIVVIKSTILPGTTEMLQQKHPQHKILFNPEFLTQSSADNDMAYPDRQIVGYTKQSYNVAGDVMRILPLAPFERIIPSTEAEMVKYFGNTWFSTKVVFANQMYDVCAKLGLDYNSVKDCAAADKRIGPSHLDVHHGGYRGYGGACLPKDTRALIQFGEKIGISLELLRKVEEINNCLIEQGQRDKDR